MSENERLILVAVLAVVMVAVVYFEMRVMRSKSKEIRRVNQKKDEAFNDILTTRSVMNALSNQGRSTGNAAVLLERAKGAMERGDYERCVDMCAKARNELTLPSKGALPADERAGEEASDNLEKVAENILSEDMKPTEADSYKGTKLSSASEGNYMGAKFELAAAKADISRSVKAGVDVSEAETLMAQAETSFTAGNYDKALSFAVRARRALSEEADREAIPLKPASAKSTREAAPKPKVYDVEEEKTPSGFTCPNCGKLADPSDIFCGHCGARTSGEKMCNACGAKAKPEDTFCRKCGERI